MHVGNGERDAAMGGSAVSTLAEHIDGTVRIRVRDGDSYSDCGLARCSMF